MMWQNELRSAIRDPLKLLEYCGLTVQDVAIDVKPAFKVFVPIRWLSHIKKHEPKDPLLLQVLSYSDEQLSRPVDMDDPLEEKESILIHGMLHKYPKRVLIMTSGACPIHCRYCFRRHFPYDSNILTKDNWAAIMLYLQTNDIDEVILSGGDPLMLSDQRIYIILDDLINRCNIRKIRFHTRFLTSIPARFSDNFFNTLLPFVDHIIWVMHINHAQELDADVHHIVKRLMGYGMRVLSQSVLLKDVNDNLSTLQELMWALDTHGIQPYYLHQMDRVSGAGHYDVSIIKGLELMKELQQTLPGYLVPKYVKEIPNKKSKTTLSHDLIDVLL